jgi:dCMP deaminase
MGNQPGRIFLVDQFYTGKLADELRELGLDIMTDLTLPPQPLTISIGSNDALILFIQEDQISFCNDVIMPACQNATLIYQVRPDVLPHFPLDRFKDVWDFDFNSKSDPRIVALEIKKALGLIPEVPDWDTYFMSLVYLAAMRSKDANTHMGAVIVRPDNTVVSTGYNSFPRGIDDHKLERQVRPEKYLWFNHAEYNAIVNARTDLNGCRLYTNGIPCMERCVGAIINSGISEVIVDASWGKEWRQKWQEQGLATKESFKESGVELRFWEGEIIPKIERYRCGKFIN